MPAPTMSYVICTGALVIMIFAAQIFYMYVIDNVWAEMARRELKEIADYVSNTLANLFFLVNSTSYSVTIEKNLDLPSRIQDSIYIVKIENNTEGFAESINAYLKKKPWVSADSWILPNLKVDEENRQVESGEKILVAGCYRDVNMDVYLWIKEA